MSLRIIFMGTPEFSVPTLLALHRAGHEIVACYTQPPRPAGRRGLELVPSPVHEIAEKLNIPVHTPKSLKDADAQQTFVQLEADVAVVVAYGLLLPQSVLDAPKHGCFNGHASLLPRWRGAAPIQRAIMAGDEETGMMVMKMEVGLDTGPIAMTRRVAILPTTTAGSLHDDLSDIGSELMVEAMALLESGDLELSPQSEEGVIYASKISKAECRINWDQPANNVQRHIMGLSPFPGAWCEMPLGEKLDRVKVLEASVVANSPSVNENSAGKVLNVDLVIACKSGAVQLNRLQRAGAKAMDRQAFISGNPLPLGLVLP